MPPRRLVLLVLLGVLCFGGALFAVARLFTGTSGLARAVAWGPADVGDIDRFPRRAIARDGAIWPLPAGVEPAGFRAVLPGDDFVGVELDRYLAAHDTTALLVVHRGQLVYERYFNGGGADRPHTSFSVAKSILSTLIGLAVADGAISGLDEPITRQLPELAERDKRFANITVGDLLTMSSGIRYEERGLPWSDDSVTYYATDLRELALERTEIDRPPGQEWRYNNYHPLLLGLILERAVGMPVTEFASRRLWQPMGAEADASWSLDSEGSGFEKLESGFNARPRDYARFGRLMLEQGRRDGRTIVPRAWVSQATSGESHGDPANFYGALWWVEHRQGGGREPFFARGNHGQLIAVIPERDAVVVRLGSGFADVNWPEFALDLAEHLDP